MKLKIKLTASLSLVALLIVASPTFAADDYLKEANSIISTRATQSRDQAQSYDGGSIFDMFRKSNDPEASSAGDERIQKTSMAYPTGRMNTSNLLIEKMYPSVVRSGKPYEYTIKVTNLTELSLNDVNIAEIIPSGFEVISAEPKFSGRSGNKANWDLGTLGPKNVRTITVKGKATSNAELPCCTTADYGLPALCHNSAVVQPSLDVMVKVPSSKIICDAIPVEFTVKNTGDSYLNDVMITSQLPAGITTADGASSVSLKAGQLAEGQSRTFTKMVKASKTGNFSFLASAKDNTDISASSKADSVNVTRPAITVTAKANRSKQYVGRNVGYTVTARNSGTITTTDTLVTASIPSGAKFVSADNGGNAAGGQVRWNIGTLAAGASKTLGFEVTASRSGELQTNAQAKAYCCQDTDLAKANIEGIPALLLEVVDVADPIEMGNEQTYVITITNQGTADANNVSIAAELEGMSYVSVSGASTGSASGNMVTLRSIPRIPAKDKVTWRVTAKTTEAGDRRFKVKMNSDELGRSVDETESTFVY